VGTIGNQARLQVGLTGFTLRQTDAIDYSKYSLSAPYQATNVGHIAYTGAEATVTYRFAGHQQIDLGETFVHAGAPAAGLISEYAYNFASHNGSFAYQAVFPKMQLAARTQVSVVQQTTKTAYPLWSVALTRTQGRVRPYVRTEDLANVRYTELPGVPLPGRSVMAGVTLMWVGRQ
jgi:iron complex outermembrane receptor protein